jgi:transcriptional regulator with GAF, ATPase, and Fis domain
VEPELGLTPDVVHSIIRQRATFRTIMDQVRTIANTDSVTLIQGDAGTGKEVIARAIHDQHGGKDPS